MSKEYTQALDDLFGLVAFQKSLTKEQFERLQKYDDIIEKAFHKLKQYDDLMGKYNIKNIKELEKILERDRFNSIGKSIQYCKNEVIEK